MICRCEEVTIEVIQCPEHFHLWKAGRRLTSVGSIIKERFPFVATEATENAKIRGIEVDRLFTEYVRNGRIFIPKGSVREDSKELFLKLQRWYDKQNFSEVLTQVPLGDTDHGGVVDLIIDGVPVEVKATYNIEHTYRLQAAAYACLHGLGDADILHVTERFAEPRRIAVQQPDYDDWQTLRDCWRMIQRRTA